MASSSGASIQYMERWDAQSLLGKGPAFSHFERTCYVSFTTGVQAFFISGRYRKVTFLWLARRHYNKICDLYRSRLMIMQMKLVDWFARQHYSKLSNFLVIFIKPVFCFCFDCGLTSR